MNRREYNRLHGVLVKALLLGMSERYDALAYKQGYVNAEMRHGGYLETGLRGESDIFALVPRGRDRLGRPHLPLAVFVEAKIGPDTLGKNQVIFKDAVESRGGLFIVARSVEQTLAEIDCALGRSTELFPPSA